MTTLTSAELDALKSTGFVLLSGLMGDDLLERLRSAVRSQFEREGEAAGSEFKQEPGCRRLANLVNKGEVFRDMIEHPVILECVRSVLGQHFKLSSLNARMVLPGCRDPQPLHADMGAVPDNRGNWVCNTIWMLDDFTLQNGAPRVVPGSHGWGRLPNEVLADPLATHPEETIITGTAGSVIVMNAHAWHGGMPNVTNQPRTAVHAFYARSDKPQQQYQRELLDRELQDRLTPSLRSILALDDPLNDELSSGECVRSGFMK